MTTPGTQIVSRAAPPNRGGTAQTGVWHIAGLSERGATDSSRMLFSLADYEKHFGNRTTYGVRDAVEAYFRNGGTAVNMIRVVGPAATVATVALPGAAAADSLEVDSVGAGASTLSVAVEDVSDGRFVLTVFEDGDRLQTSPPLATPADAVNWAKTSPYVTVRAIGSIVPSAIAPADLAGGDDDRAAVTDTVRLAALDLISAADGPGQVSLPGATTSVAHAGLAAHAEATNRLALLDAPNSLVEGDLISAAEDGQILMTELQKSYCFLVDGWHLIPGVVQGNTRVVPPSPVVAALMAAHDVLTGNPNDPAAGINGIASYSLGFARPEWSDEARGRLNLAGVNVFKAVNNQQRLYGYRTLVDPSGAQAAWLSASNARLRMAIQARASDVAEAFVFSQISRAKIAEYHGVLSGMLLGYYDAGALFGDTPEDAFVVDTGETVNTPERIANRRLSAVVGVRMNEFAEVVYMEFVKIPVTEELT